MSVVDTLADIIQRSMEAAGMDRDDDPLRLPEFIENLRFAGNHYVAQEYPRHDQASSSLP